VSRPLRSPSAYLGYQVGQPLELLKVRGTRPEDQLVHADIPAAPDGIGWG
jgi:hypothetical protein